DPAASDEYLSSNVGERVVRVLYKGALPSLLSLSLRSGRAENRPLPDTTGTPRTAPPVHGPPDHPGLLWESRYRVLLRHAFRLMAEASAANPALCTRTLDEVAVLTDNLGP